MVHASHSPLASKLMLDKNLFPTLILRAFSCCCVVLQCVPMVAVCCSVLQYDAAVVSLVSFALSIFGVLHCCVAVRCHLCSELYSHYSQSVAVLCCSAVLQCCSVVFTVCCNVLQGIALRISPISSALSILRVYCNVVIQCYVAVLCCSVVLLRCRVLLQCCCIEMCCNILQ